MNNFKNGKILIYYKKCEEGEKLKKLTDIAKHLEVAYHLEVTFVKSKSDFMEDLLYKQDLSCILMEYDSESIGELDRALKFIRKHNKKIPVIAFTGNKDDLNKLNLSEIKELNDFCFLYEDTVDFLAGRIEEHSKNYMSIVESPFLNNLIKYAKEYKYAWHTPGHMGGCAFLKNPPGKYFYDFLGENVFRTDLSVSVPELGSLLDHEGPIGDSEKFAARVFGADQTYYVLNGTSSVNQIIWRGRVTRDELAFVDRNCHKSLNYAMTITEAIPTYITPRRNGLGIIGPVKLEEFTADYIRNEVKNNPLVSEEKAKENIKMLTLTNSTYDGLCYNVSKIKETLDKNVKNLHFDEAWYAYAKFHPLYKNFFAMTDDLDTENHPPIFASHSTHKLLAAFSQASMLHIKDGSETKVDPEIFNEAYMMYGSTSPQYNMIASLDVATNMMDFNGEDLLEETIKDAIDLRKNISKLYEEEKDNGGWFFSVWQPETTMYEGKETRISQVPTEFLAKDQKTWTLDAKKNWHGFEDIEDDYVMVDPLKITIKMPGINVDGSLEEEGIPAAIVSNYLINFGVVAEKTDYYSLLILNSIGTTKSKQGSLISGLSQLKKLYDENAPLSEVFPELVKSNPGVYDNVGLKDHCTTMHQYIKEHRILELMAKSYQIIPKPTMKPAEAARKVFKEEVEKVSIANMKGRVAAIMVVPYPPGIPMVMGGEIIDDSSEPIVDYLLAREKFEKAFPGYYGDIHGIEVVEENGERKFQTLVLK
ncbi:Orn/Lys/Arg decarboxylase N-terminal domain-containing protein [uncultured Clostridium sp.]|uniref:Orn/Lys/Arg family decarboxylase n=1 Tax=uncultured Clostridium sp. TaxID=59620 RepID=UPI002627C4AB|nr:Orn/Lys/Arg decarboxylase N-terminal domain-containing protein [uncultured Clostridium sp.]